MEKIIVLGTGMAIVVDTFNTAFVLQDNNQKKLLVDTGGGKEILKQLKNANMDLNDIHDIFISHKHIDHFSGLLWLLRLISYAMKKGEYEGDLTIYCHDEMAIIIQEQLNIFCEKIAKKFLNTRIFIQVVNDHEIVKVLSYDLEFIDIQAKKDKQYGFKTTLNNGKTLAFMGDEPMNESLYDEVKNIDYLLHEAFCLETEADKFQPKEKGHDTVKSASLKAQKIQAKNLVLWHTSENLGKERKEKYTQEAKENFDGNVYVPNDLEIIELI